MDYDDFRAAFFAEPEPGQQAPGSDTHRTQARLLRDVGEPLATVAFWSRPAFGALGGLGLEFPASYVGARAAALGDVPAALVTATFGVFAPAMIASLIDEASATATRADMLEARLNGSTTALRQLLGERPEGVDDVVVALRRGIDAADLAGRPLFAAHTALPWPQDPVGALWHAVVLLRELRGDSHLAVGITAGLSGLAMNLLTELWVGYPAQAYTATRGWTEHEMATTTAQLADLGLVADGSLTAAGATLRGQLEDATDLAMASTLTAIGPDLPDVLARLGTWADAVVAAGLVPPDPYKRAAG